MYTFEQLFNGRCRYSALGLVLGRFLLIAATDDLKEQISGVRVVGEIADLINAEY